MNKNNNDAYGRWVDPPAGVLKKYRILNPKRGKTQFKVDRQNLVKEAMDCDDPPSLDELAKRFLVRSQTIRQDLKDLGIPLPKKGK